MENTKKKSGKGLVICLTIFMLVFAACAALLFTGVIKSPMVKCEEKVVEKTSTKTADDTKKSSTTEKTADERYKEYISGLAESIKKNYISDHKVDEGGYETSDQYNSSRHGNTSNGIYTISVTSNLELVYSFLPTSSVSTEEKKLADNVVSYYDVYTGNGAMSTLYFITTDGVVHKANLEQNLYNGEELVITDLEYKNIIEVKAGSHWGGAMPIFVDIDGNVYMK